MNKKEIWQVEVGCNEERMVPTNTFLYFYWKRIAEGASCTFFKFYSKISF